MESKGVLSCFSTFGWSENRDLSDDENYMDLTLLITRTSKLKQGGMACILVRDKQGDNESLVDRIVSVSNNKALYRGNNSDIHAEVAAIGEAAKAGRSSNNCTAYITMPPCKGCFASLYCAGIRRIVSRKAANLGIDVSKIGIDMVVVQENRTRVNQIIANHKLREKGEACSIEEVADRTNKKMRFS